MSIYRETKFRNHSINSTKGSILGKRVSLVGLYDKNGAWLFWGVVTINLEMKKLKIINIAVLII